jgi:hypothetical protein
MMEDIIGLIPDGPADLAKNHKAYLRSRIHDKAHH